MTRISKIHFIERNDKTIKIVYNREFANKRLIVREIQVGSTIELYNTTSEDQVKAGQLIDLLFWELTRNA